MMLARRRDDRADVVAHVPHAAAEDADVGRAGEGRQVGLVDAMRQVTLVFTPCLGERVDDAEAGLAERHLDADALGRPRVVLRAPRRASRFSVSVVSSTETCPLERR